MVLINEHIKHSYTRSYDTSADEIYQEDRHFSGHVEELYVLLTLTVPLKTNYLYTSDTNLLKFCPLTPGFY